MSDQAALAALLAACEAARDILDDLTSEGDADVYQVEAWQLCEDAIRKAKGDEEVPA